MNTIRLRKEGWREHRQNQLMSELESLGDKTASTLETSKDSAAKHARAVLLHELKILDLHFRILLEKKSQSITK
jgi:hypothetical protein